MPTTVGDVMTRRVRAATPDEPIAEAARTMKQEDIGSLPVVDDGRLSGVVTDRDIVVRAVADGRDPRTIAVGEIASHDLVTAGPEQALDDALARMARHRIRRMPVVEGERLVGMLSLADLVTAAPGQEAGALVAEISQPTSIARE